MKPGKRWECSKCSKTFHTCQDLTRHVVTHDPHAKVKCEVCGKFCKNQHALSLHVSRLHTNRKRPSCDTCHRVFFDLFTLRQHIGTVHSTKERPRLACGVSGCAKTYLDKRSLGQHLRKEHAENPVRFPCTLCGMDFKSRTELTQHIPTHTTEKPYKCTTCGKSFARRGDMKSHEKSRRHVSKCHVCPQTFFSRHGLQYHVRVVHENQRNYPCTFCDMKFSQSLTLKRHVEAKHAANKDLKIYSCEKCEFKSKSKNNLASHRMRHNPARIGCYFCAKRFFRFNELVPHCRVHTLEK
ncbi:zinc finger protein 135-like isoform X2 [Folsomia candida]|uniref:zinc finger protein 135-like isoform X2 n=1 Tax=Folsomia candida TaxID=158441 RepID=UPI0016052A6C|nr:zinc finger protein 135-like isoform X2 [Folsomia candida]